MVEVRFHGRAGQGAKTAAQILAEAALKENQFVQAFPQFGPARRGAAVSAFVRISSTPLSLHSQIKVPDFVVVLDRSLLTAVDVFEGTASSNCVLINSSSPQPRATVIDASKIARHFIGKDWPNLVMLGAWLKLAGDLVSLKTVETAVATKFESRWGVETTQKNILALRQGYREVV